MPGAPGQLPAQHLPHPPHVYQEDHAHRRRRLLGDQRERHKAGRGAVKAGGWEGGWLLLLLLSRQISFNLPTQEEEAEEERKGQRRCGRGGSKLLSDRTNIREGHNS